MINTLFTKPVTSRIRFVIGSGLSMVATDLARAKLSTMLTSAKIATMETTKLAASKMVATLTAIWLLFVGFFMPAHKNLTPVAVAPKLAIHHHHRHLKPVTPPVLEAPVSPLFSNKLYLHTFEQEYTLVFSGKVSCGEAICHNATLELHIASMKNPNLVKAIPIQADGTYETSLVVKDYLHEHLDWWLVADSPDSASQQIQGREILSEDPNVTVEQPITLL